MGLNHFIFIFLLVTPFFAAKVQASTTEDACKTCSSLILHQTKVLEARDLYLHMTTRDDQRTARAELLKALGKSRPSVEATIQEIKSNKTSVNSAVDTLTEFLAKIDEQDYERVVLEDVYPNLKPILKKITTAVEVLTTKKKITPAEKNSLLESLQVLEKTSEDSE